MADDKSKKPADKQDRYDRTTPDPRKYQDRQLENEQEQMEEQEKRERTETHQRTKDPQK